jgi:hypothetical protein
VPRRAVRSARRFVVPFLSVEIPGPLRGPFQYRLVRHARTGAAAQDQQSADQRAGYQNEDDDRFRHGFLGYELSRIKPSCAALATSRPSRANTLPRVKPRAPEALGLSTA